MLCVQSSGVGEYPSRNLFWRMDHVTYWSDLCNGRFTHVHSTLFKRHCLRSRAACITYFPLSWIPSSTETCMDHCLRRLLTIVSKSSVTSGARRLCNTTDTRYLVRVWWAKCGWLAGASALRCHSATQVVFSMNCCSYETTFMINFTTQPMATSMHRRPPWPPLTTH